LDGPALSPIEGPEVFGNPGKEMMLVGSLATLFAVLVSPPPLTAAWLTTALGALARTVTVTVIGGYEVAAASAFARVHVTVWPAGAGHVHPVPAAAVGVSPAGNVSVTVTGAVVVAPPMLVTVSV
jgi:hypothetical protein